MLEPENTEPVLIRLDEELTKVGEKRSLIICGGGALIVMKVIERRTRDVDVIAPEVDLLLKKLAAQVGKEFGLSDNWLNNGPASLVSDLSAGWQKRTVPVFAGKALELRALGRPDLLATKLYAFCDREDDLDDVLKLRPTNEELEALFPWVLERDGSPYWPKRVEDCFKRLRGKLKHG
jgi:hypothetical protein